MREITVKIPENKYDAFVAMMKELKIEVPEHEVDDEIEIPEWQKKIVRERIKNAKADNFVSWEEARKKLRFKTK